jgi:methylglyoxal synthase
LYTIDKETDRFNIALTAHDAKKELLVNFCNAYFHIFSQHNLSATGKTAKILTTHTDLKITSLFSGEQGGLEQLATNIAYNAVDLLLFFRDPNLAFGDFNKEFGSTSHNDIELLRLCDVYKIPFATNPGTADALLLALESGNLNWRLFDRDRYAL